MMLESVRKVSPAVRGRKLAHTVSRSTHVTVSPPKVVSQDDCAGLEGDAPV